MLINSKNYYKPYILSYLPNFLFDKFLNYEQYSQIFLSHFLFLNHNLIILYISYLYFKFRRDNNSF